LSDKAGAPRRRNPINTHHLRRSVMTITRYTPWAFQNGVHEEFKNALNKLFGENDADQSNVVTSQWAPRVDIKEEANRFVILADIPGVDPKDIEVSMDKGVLSIKGERNAEVKEETEKFTRMERTRGLFYRRFSLPDSAHAEGISAHGKHGVLEIVIPKKPETTPRRIAIHS
jgi:HSP20 family protein